MTQGLQLTRVHLSNQWYLEEIVLEFTTAGAATVSALDFLLNTELTHIF